MPTLEKIRQDTFDLYTKMACQGHLNTIKEYKEMLELNCQHSPSYQTVLTHLQNMEACLITPPEEDNPDADHYINKKAGLSAIESDLKDFQIQINVIKNQKIKAFLQSLHNSSETYKRLHPENNSNPTLSKRQRTESEKRYVRS